MTIRPVAALRRILGFCVVIPILGVGFLADSQQSEQQPPEELPEAEIEPTPIPGTEIPLEPQLAAPEPSEEVIRLEPAAAAQPILPPVIFEALGRSGRLWSFHGVVKEFRFIGNHVF